MTPRSLVAATLRRAAERLEPSVSPWPAVVGLAVGLAIVFAALAKRREDSTKLRADVDTIDRYVIPEIKRRMSVASTASGERVHFEAAGDPEGYCGEKTPRAPAWSSGG